MYEVRDVPTQYVDQQPCSKNYREPVRLTHPYLSSCEIYQKESDEVYVQLRPSITNNKTTERLKIDVPALE